MHLEPPPARRRASRRCTARGGRTSQHPLDGMVRSPFVAAPVRGGEVGRVGRRTSAAHGYQLVALEAHGMACRKTVVYCRLSAERLADPARPPLSAESCDRLPARVSVARTRVSAHRFATHRIRELHNWFLCAPTPMGAGRGPCRQPSRGSVVASPYEQVQGA